MVTTTRDFLPQFIHKPPNFAPEQGCRFCNCSYILLGLVIEQITGMTYRDYVEMNIFHPACMSDSGFFHVGQVFERVAEGCDPVRDENEQILQWKKNVYSFPPIGTPDSRAYVTATDLDRFLRAVKSGKLLSPDQAQAFFTPQVHYRRMKTGWDMFYGLGMWFYVDPGGQVVCSEKEGSKPGASSLIRHFPNHDINLVIWRTWKMPPRILPGISMIWSSLAVWINRLSN